MSRELEAAPHRSRGHTFFLVERWDAEAAWRQQAQAWLRAWPPRPGDTRSLLSAAAKPAKRGHGMDAVATMQAPTGVTVMALVAAASLGHTVVKACRQPHGHVASIRTRHRSLFKPGWQLDAGRYGRHLGRRRRTTSRVRVPPQGEGRSRHRDAGGRHQNRPYRAAAIPRPLVCFASALRPHRRIERDGAQGQRTRKKAADLATAQDQLRGVLGEDLRAYRTEHCHAKASLAERERRRVA